jgi:hypothetical protein
VGNNAFSWLLEDVVCDGHANNPTGFLLVYAIPLKRKFVRDLFFKPNVRPDFVLHDYSQTCQSDICYLDVIIMERQLSLGVTSRFKSGIGPVRGS